MGITCSRESRATARRFCRNRWTNTPSRVGQCGKDMSMKFVSFRSSDGTVRGGILHGSEIRMLPRSGSDDVLAHIASGALQPVYEGSTVPLSEMTLLAPL